MRTLGTMHAPSNAGPSARKTRRLKANGSEVMTPDPFTR